MTQATDSNASATLSGRELALNRRKAMSKHGKAGVKKSAAGVKPSAQRVAPQTSAGATGASYAIATASTGRSASRARRAALSTAGKSALQSAQQASMPRPSGRTRPSSSSTASVAQQAPASEVRKSCGCGCNGTKTSCDTSSTPLDTTSAASATSYATAPAAQYIQSSGRALARARRAALAQDGKSGLKRVAQATKLASALPGQDWDAAMASGGNGRQKAMQRRKVQSLAGNMKGESQARPAGRMRARMDIPAPAKVEQGHTLSGRSVTGTMIERNKKVTGNEPGSCRAITGTEYIGSEQFDNLCATRPEPSPLKQSAVKPQRATPPARDTSSRERGLTGTSVARSGKVTGNESGSERAITGTEYVAPSSGVRAPEKVAVTHTGQGKTVTGTAVGHSTKTTGDESGSCRPVTGIDYIAAEQFSGVCKTTPPAAPRKVSVMSSRDEQTVSGSNVGRSEKVTGDEPGSCRSITGSQYYTPASFGSLCDVTGPKKVGSMQTLSGRSVTGTEVGRSRRVTGDEPGSCKAVTGTEYIGSDQQSAVCDTSTPVAPVVKVAVDQTWRGLAVTGTYVGRSTKVTGDESGGCSPISGTPYIGRGQYNNFCEAPATQGQEARIKTSALIPATVVTGDRPGSGGSVMTGDERGACEIVSGTPYVGSDNMVSQCTTSNRFISRSSTYVEPARPPAPIDFSIVSPARAAQQRHEQSGEVTGSAYSGERITGPGVKADGLITGTPEFRHRDAGTQRTAQEEVLTAARRLTGEGSQSGRNVTGDAWGALSRVTGTEGASSNARNSSARGNPRGMGMNAVRFRDETETPPVPESRITGSSGNTGRGALVTLSGGARG